MRGNTRAQSCGCYNKEQLTETHSGVNNCNWKDGITTLQNTIRSSPLYKGWRKAIFERDSYTCQYSGIVGGELAVHHKVPFHTILEDNNITSVEEAKKCKELWDTNNGITLAKEYHSFSSSNPKSFHVVYSNRATEQDFREWFAERVVS